MLINQTVEESKFKEWSNEDLTFLISALRHKLERKEVALQKMKKDLLASRNYNGKLQQKIIYLQRKVVDYYGTTPENG